MTKMKGAFSMSCKTTQFFEPKEYVDRATGEVITAYTTITEAADRDFSKIWIKNALEKLEIIGNKKTKVAYWIVEHMNGKNELNMTYKEIESATGSSHGTVVSTIKALVAGDFLQKRGNGRYVVNPALIYRGSHGGRMNIMNEYIDSGKAKGKQKTAQQKLDELNKYIEKLQRQAQDLAQEVVREEMQ